MDLLWESTIVRCPMPRSLLDQRRRGGTLYVGVLGVAMAITKACRPPAFYLPVDRRVAGTPGGM